MRAGTKKKAGGLWHYTVLKGWAFILLLALGVLCNVRSGSGDVKPEPKRLAKVAPGNCAACHGGAKILPAAHINTKAMTWESCEECHNKEGKTLRTKIPLNHTHLLAGTTCKDCHENLKSPEPVKSQQCLSCHGSREEVVKMTAKLNPNPHTSPHYGPDLDCDLCHHQHSNSENYCAQCHSWSVIVPNQK